MVYSKCHYKNESSLDTLVLEKVEYLKAKIDQTRVEASAMRIRDN